MMPMQPGDVGKTWASTKALNQVVGYESKISLEEGVKQFVNWYKLYY